MFPSLLALQLVFNDVFHHDHGLGEKPGAATRFGWDYRIFDPTIVRKEGPGAKGEQDVRMGVGNIPPYKSPFAESNLGRTVVVETTIQDGLPRLSLAEPLEVRERGGRRSCTGRLRLVIWKQAEAHHSRFPYLQVAPYILAAEKRIWHWH